MAYVHAKRNDEYFTNAEEKASLEVFWNENSSFRKMFQKLDLDNVVELACGWGRHVPKYYGMAGHITLVDILQENIDICKKRFGEDDKISYYKNNGYDYENLKDETYTAVFSYDAMVHFEMFDIYKYLCDTYRILKPGEMALFHHSNYNEKPEMDFIGTDHARNYMSKDLFHYLVCRAGLKVLD
ncbi:MAG: class I SAM-dependent methyltransferase [Lachnospiraceae bacterium]|nr:class I SAM-dependent methyltransferase [Lachnospiraceae bacterium]